MDKVCYVNGACKECGCKTTHLQMCERVCDGFCYPPLMSRVKWDCFFTNHPVIINGDVWLKKNSSFAEFQKQGRFNVMLYKNGELKKTITNG